MVIPPREVLVELLYDKGWSVSQIAEYFGVSERTVYSWLKKLNLSKPSEIQKERKLRDIVQGYLHLNGIKQLRTKYDQTLIDEALNGIDTSPEFGPGNVRRRLKNCVPLTSELDQIIIGELLGDSSLSYVRRKKGVVMCSDVCFPTPEEYQNAIDDLWLISTTVFSGSLPVDNFVSARETVMLPHLSKFEMEMVLRALPWVEHLADLISWNGYSCSVNVIEDKDKVKLHTMATLALERKRQQWYRGLIIHPGRQGLKCVPAWLVLTPRIVLHWLVGDGSHNTKEFNLYTNGFPAEDVEFLAWLLSREIGTEVKRREKKPGQWYLAISRLNVDHLFTYLERDPSISTSLEIAKNCFPWKFNLDLQMQDCV